ncbi:glutathionylspermidine synthase family protein [Escherichia coli]
MYWDESRAYRFTLRQIEEQIEKPTAELHQMCLEVVERAVKDEEIPDATGDPSVVLGCDR